MRSNKVIHHPGRNAENFSTVEDEIESLRDNRVTGPASATDNAIVRFDGTTGKLVQNSVVTIADTTGNMVGIGTLAAGGTITKNGGTTVAGVGQTFAWSWYFPSATAKDYRLHVNFPVAVTITSVTTRSEAGTCTLTGKINSTALGGTANSVSTSEEAQAHSSANAMAVGDDFVLTPSAISSLVGMSVTVAFTVNLA